MTNPIKICWIQHASEWPLVEQLARALTKDGIESIFVSITKAVHEQYLKDGFQSVFLSEIFNDAGTISREELERLDKQYGPPGMAAIGISDVRLKALFRGDLAGR